MIDLRIKQEIASHRPAFNFDIAGRYAEHTTVNGGQVQESNFKRFLECRTFVKNQTKVKPLPVATPTTVM